MIAGALYAAEAVALFSLLVIAVRPMVFGRELAPVSALIGMMVEWFTPQLIFLHAVVTAGLCSLGVIHEPLVEFGLVVGGVACLGLGRYVFRLHRSVPLLDGHQVGDDELPFPLAAETGGAPGRVSWVAALTLRSPAVHDVEVVRDVVYREVEGVCLRLDVYRPRQAAGTLPVALYVHGGAWVMGTRRQSRFMMRELAASGFVVFAVSYRLAPRFPLPRGIEDVKAAVAWVRKHAGGFGGDGARICVLGGSAGGHLAALLALTPNDPRFQPGFEREDTSVQGAVILYGAADIIRPLEADRLRIIGGFIERVVFRRRFLDDPELFRRADPFHHLRPTAPPFLLVHGELDAMVPISVSRRFAEGLRRAGAEAVHLLEVPHAHHAFELFPTPAHQRAVRVIARFMRWVDARPRAVAAQSAGSNDPVALSG